MQANRSSLWGIVLAGGEGERLKEFVQEHLGTNAPKQFCSFVGRRTMLERTLRRARFLIPSERLVVVGTAHHRTHIFGGLGNRPPSRVLLQPMNRGTAPGILLPLIHILRQDPHALVAILPSDHFVLPGRRFMRAAAEAADHLIETTAESLIVLAVEPTGPETDYGWIEPGPFISSDGQMLSRCAPCADPLIVRSIQRINRFIEKPSREQVGTLMAEGWLWNTMVIVARAQSLVKLIQQTVPELVACFEIIQRYIGTNLEHAVLNEVYQAIPSMNFSATVLARRSEDLLVLPVRKVRWSDWGRKERIVETLTELGLSWPTPVHPNRGRQVISA